MAPHTARREFPVSLCFTSEEYGGRREKPGSLEKTFYFFLSVVIVPIIVVFVVIIAVVIVLPAVVLPVLIVGHAVIVGAGGRFRVVGDSVRIGAVVRVLSLIHNSIYHPTHRLSQINR